MTHTVYLALGSNLGDKSRNLRLAVKELKRVIKLKAYSKIYETPAWGVTNQPSFLNACVGGDTDLAPELLLEATQKIEKLVGRTETYRWGPRIIDIDILFYDDLVVSSPSLTIPHPGIPERAFVLVPLADIASDFVHPQLKTAIKTLKKKHSDRGIKSTNQKLN